ncbi:unnamed protein product [Ophioblennius macclurei]
MLKGKLLLLLLLLLVGAASSHRNLALRGKATQSHRYAHDFGSAYTAIDGNRDGIFDHGSCTHSAQDSNPWWRVDLLDSYVITSVVIANRQDCCFTRLSGLQIHVGNSLDRDGLANPKVGEIVQGSVETVYTNLTERVEGRYVTLSLPGHGKYLTLCEVEVYGYPAPTGENLALKGKASQSSLDAFGLAYNAIDGNRDTRWDRGSCSRTGKEGSPWWRLDLGRTHKVFSVDVTNEELYPERLDGAEIHVGDSLDNDGNTNARCAVISNLEAGAVTKFECYGLDGRYVNIVIPDKEDVLTLCEVEVYGSPLD